MTHKQNEIHPMPTPHDILRPSPTYYSSINPLTERFSLPSFVQRMFVHDEG